MAKNRTRLKLSQKIVLEKFYYENGHLFYRKGNNKERRAGCYKGKYFRISINYKVYPLHRVIFLYHHGYFPEKQVDHIDRDTHNNKIENLREASWQCNARNSKIEIRNTSGVRGVSKDYDKWRAIIRINQKFCHIGSDASFEEAVCLRLAAEQAVNWAGCDSTSSAFLYVRENIQKRN